MPQNKNGGNNEAKTNLNALLQSMVEGMVLQDSAGKILQFNQAALSILGLTEEQLLNRDFIDSVIQNKMFPGKNHIGLNSLKSGEIQRNVVLNIFRYDGEMRWISLNSVPIMNLEKPEESLLVSTFTDITEMRKVLSDLKQVQLLFNISHDLMIIANQDGYFRRINPRFTEVLGYTLPDIVSKKFTHFIHPEDLELTEVELKKLQEKKDTIHFINRYKARDGDYRIFDWVVVPDHETHLIYFTARDITDYRAEELEVIHSSKFYSIGEMTSGIAYVIHGQLSVIGGHIAFIQDQIEKGSIDIKELRNKVTSIEDSIQRLSKTTKELTTFARDSENEKITEVSLSKILETVLGLCKERFRIHGVKLEVKIEDNLIIRCRQSQLAHVFITLLNNAYNEVHTERDSWVDLNCKAQDGILKILITSSAMRKQEHIKDLEKEKVTKSFFITQGIIKDNFGTFYFDQTGPRTKIVLEFPLIQRENELEEEESEKD